MSQYVVGDIQGCFDEFERLLRHLDFNPGKDTMILAGDVVNRGPKSLETLRFVKSREGCVRMILGNHDLSLLHTWYTGCKPKKHDTIQDVLASDDAPKLMDWLRSRPLMIEEDDCVIVHAGLWPEWTSSDAVGLARETEEVLSSRRHHLSLFKHMFGGLPDRWNRDEEGHDRRRFVLNAMTRMRCLKKDDLRFAFEYNKGLEGMPGDLIPWFRWPERKWSDRRIIFGHWSALGLHVENGTVCLDTGAVWGGTLTAMDLDVYKKTGETRFHSVPSLNGRELID